MFRLSAALPPPSIATDLSYPHSAPPMLSAAATKHRPSVRSYEDLMKMDALAVSIISLCGGHA